MPILGISNILDYMFIGVLLVFGFWGWKKGFIKIGFSLLSFIISIIIAIVLYPVLSKFLISTPVYDGIINIITPNIQNNSVNFESEFSANLLNTVTGSISGYIALFILNIITFILVLIISKIIISIIGKTLNIFASLPIINLVNKLCGSVLGVLEGLIIACLILSATFLIPALSNNTSLYNLIDTSSSVRYLYQNNPITYFILPDPKEIYVPKN